MGFLWTVCTLSEEVYSVLQQSFLAFLHWPVDQKTGLDHPLEVHLFLLPHERPHHWQSGTDKRNTQWGMLPFRIKNTGGTIKSPAPPKRQAQQRRSQSAAVFLSTMPTLTQRGTQAELSPLRASQLRKITPLTAHPRSTSHNCRMWLLALQRSNSKIPEPLETGSHSYCLTTKNREGSWTSAGRQP